MKKISKNFFAKCFTGRAHARRGFSATELIVVIAILALLAAMVTAAVAVAQRTAGASRIRADLQAISTALEQYRSDFNMYPGVSSDIILQRQVLAKALIGPGDAKDDGFNGTGFCVVPGGKVWEPYLAPEKFQVKNLAATGVSRWVLADHLGNVIRYFPVRRTFSANSANSLAGNASARCIFEMDDAENNLFASTPRDL